MPCHFVLTYFSYTLCPVILYSFFIFHIHDALSFCTHLFFIYMMPCNFVLIHCLARTSQTGLTVPKITILVI